jgi:DNA-binding transcriptional LysR family regulator
LRLTVPLAVVPILLEPLIASFCRAYPEVEVEIAASADLVDIAAEGFDADILLGQFIEAGMIAVPSDAVVPADCGRQPRLSAPAAAAGTHRRSAPARLPAHAPLKRVSGNEAVEVIVSGPFIANDMPTMLGAAVEGLGLAQVPEPIAAGAVKAGKLVRVLEPFAPMAPGVFLYYPGHRQMMPKLRAFIDHLKSRSGGTN